LEKNTYITVCLAVLSGGLNLYVLFVILLPRDEKNEQYYQLPGLAFATITSDL